MSGQKATPVNLIIDTVVLIIMTALINVGFFRLLSCHRWSRRRMPRQRNSRAETNRVESIPLADVLCCS